METVSRRDFLKICFMMICYPAIKPFLNEACIPAVYWHGDRQIPAVAITFDDCYGHEQLRNLEELLDENPDIQVTFFPTGIGLLAQLSKDEKIWNRLLSKGHEIGYHGYNHAQPSSLSMGATLQDFKEWNNALTQILGSPIVIKYARPPYGDLCRNFLKLSCSQNFATIMWSQNWSLVHKTNFQELKTIQNGDIVLFHIREQDITNFKECIPRIRELGLRMVNLTTLLDEEKIALNINPEFFYKMDTICYTENDNSICTR
ncbi:MAG: polysaccharide deacetylase family protein [Bellilinea sp.]|nr:polysaccharide deacetylase family protein [Bellilinea sp.]